MSVPASQRQAQERGPSVPVPPPAVFLGGTLAGVVVDLVVPFRVVPQALALAGWVGAAVVGAGCLLAGLAFREFHRHRTTVRVDRAPTELMTTGPYRHSRNPLYLSGAIVQIGTGIWLNNGWIIAFVLATVPFLTRVAIKREERYLAQRFGESYETYRTRVRRWL